MCCIIGWIQPSMDGYIKPISKLEVVETCYTYRHMLWLTIIACTYYVSNMYIGMYILFVLLHCEPRKVCTEGSQKGMRMATYIYTQDWPAQIGCNLICNSSNV